ncbi:hypothetical protein CDSM653_02402 [Caldanaerobacter subterraneus subsp. pacificus DSM 12653]|uniref:Uncharacterized protein n=1 Tax=Caldanaerobacter subterraneus subsp. pacificus DSM 12653 TaxID=391606 RepID=A0A0F5PJ54_9THEO|nr:hypothetical protein CDSM653_02402 [Caldanaerobacter subterraneus subsp. pacificus DSM 12653]
MKRVKSYGLISGKDLFLAYLRGIETLWLGHLL